MSFHRTMTAIAQACDRDEHYEEALDLVRTLRRRLLAQRRPQPEQLGWVRDYELRCLYHLGWHEEGLELLLDRDGPATAIRARNDAWLHSVGAEMAVHAGRADLCPVLAMEAVCLRLQDGDEDGAVLACQTALALTDHAQRPDLGERFVGLLERLWARWPVGSAEAIRAALMAARVAKAPWFLSTLPSRERRLRELELHSAAERGLCAEVDRLLMAGTDPSARQMAAVGLPTPLIAAAFKGHEGIVRRLLDAGADTADCNAQGRTALHQAADRGHSTIVRLLCAAGAPVDARDLHRHTALHVASWQDHLGAVRALVAAGAALDAADLNGDTPLGLAATEPVPRVLRSLLKAGAPLEAGNLFGQTPLLRAAMSGQAEQVRLLLAAGADAEHRDGNGMTAGEWAAWEGHAELAASLGADPTRSHASVLSEAG